MTKEEIRILRYLSDSLGNGGSILNMTKEIGKRYGNAYYRNIYNAVMKLEKSRMISITTAGRNRLIYLNLKNPLSIYRISEADNEKSAEIDMAEPILNELLGLALDYGIITACALKSEEYTRINRIELLLITRSYNQLDELIKRLLKVESFHNTRIDPIILTPDEFSDTLEGSELNRIKDMIEDRCILYNSEGFWEIIRGYRINEKYKSTDRFPDELGNVQLAYNYGRFGYLLYEYTKPGREISLEDTIFMMSASKEARIRYGAFVLLHKNIGKINLPYLYYIFKRHDELNMLKSILAVLRLFCGEQDRLRIDTFIEAIPNKQSRIYDRKLIKKYIVQYG